MLICLCDPLSKNEEYMLTVTILVRVEAGLASFIHTQKENNPGIPS